MTLIPAGDEHQELFLHFKCFIAVRPGEFFIAFSALALPEPPAIPAADSAPPP
jgi:hypothetical protein